MLVARKPLSIGDNTLEVGEKLTRAQQLLLPPGRLAQLIEHGWVEEVIDEMVVAREVDTLVGMIHAVIDRVDRIETILCDAGLKDDDRIEPVRDAGGD